MSAMIENISEQEEKIASLERANFDLKMQVFYLNKKISDTVTPGDATEQATINVNMGEDRSSDILELREEIETGRRRIEDLESELLQLQLIRDNEALEYQKLLQSQPSTDITLLEESRRREREVAKTIAEHDAAVIAQLRLEVDSLEQQHDRDSKLVEDCTARLATQMEVFEVTTGDLARVREENNELHSKVAVLTDTARQQEQLLTEATTSRIDPQLHDLLRRENTQLKEQLERQKASIANQSDVLSKLGVTASQESQELIRMATELDVCYTARDEALLMQQKLKYENDVLRGQLHELKSIHGHSNGQFGSIPELSPGSFHRTLGGAGAAVDPKITEAYKKREKELLAALEGVIQRCRELEQAQYSQAQQQDHRGSIPHGAVAMTSISATTAAQQPRRMLNNQAPTGGPSAQLQTPGGLRFASQRASVTGEKARESVDVSRSKSTERRQSRAWQ